MSDSPRIMVYGSSGHTGRFVVDELLRRGLTPVLAGRSAQRLAAAPPQHADLERSVIGLEDPDPLRRAVEGTDVVVNCAGPMLDTALPLARAAVATGAHYLDITAEQPAAQRLYDELDEPARAAGVAVVPAMAFYGGLADLLATSALDGHAAADEVGIAVALDRWWPTAGTRATGARNTAARRVIRGGALVPAATPAPTGTWCYPAPLGVQPVVQLPFSEVVTIHRHLEIGELRSHLNSAALDDLRDPTTPPPSAVDGRGRSDQQFWVDVVVRRGSRTRRTGCTGRDIYAVTAPLLVEGVAALLRGRHRAVGASAPGRVFDAGRVLAAVERDTDDLALRRDRPFPAGGD